MKKMIGVAVLSMMVLGLSLVYSNVLMAGEHGGKEHGGSSHKSDSKEHAGSSHGLAHSASKDAGILMEAADALWDSRPDLASKLETLAKKMG